MATELRWILAALSAVLLVGIWWWGARRSRQAPGNAEFREAAMVPGAASPRPSQSLHEPEVMQSGAYDAASPDWGISPFEPLSIRTADFEPVPTDRPMRAHPEPFEELPAAQSFEIGEPPPAAPMERAATASAAEDFAASSAADAPAEPEASVAEAVQGTGPTLLGAPPQPPAAVPESPAAAPSEGPDPSEMQRIVTVRVCAEGEWRWAGLDLMVALESHGLAFGRYQVFHRKHSDGRTLFCAASLVEPGTFDVARMPDQEFRGLTLFAVLPGPADPLQTLDALIETAGGLAEMLHGTVEDSQGRPLSPQRAEALREDVARFQDLLTRN